MKITTLSRRLYAVTLALLLGVAGAWADYNIEKAVSLPGSSLADKIDINSKNTSISGVKCPDNNSNYAVGSMNVSTATITFDIDNTAAKQYVIAFAAKYNTAGRENKVKFTFEGYSSEGTFETSEVAINTPSYARYSVQLGSALPIGTYKLTVTLTQNSNSMWGSNFQDLAIVDPDKFISLPFANLTDKLCFTNNTGYSGTDNGKSPIENSQVGGAGYGLGSYNTNGGTITFDINNTTAAKYLLAFRARWNRASGDQIKFTFTSYNKGTTYEVTKAIDFKDEVSGNGANNSAYLVQVPNEMPVDHYKLTISFYNGGGTAWCPNLQDLCIVNPSTLSNLATGTAVDLNANDLFRYNATYESSGSNLGSCKRGGEVAYLHNITNVSESGYVLYFEAAANNGGQTRQVIARCQKADGTIYSQLFTIKQKDSNKWDWYFPYALYIDGLEEGSTLINLRFYNSATGGNTDNVCNVRNVKLMPVSSFNASPAAAFAMNLGYLGTNLNQGYSVDENSNGSNGNNSFLTYYFYNSKAGNYALNFQAGSDNDTRQPILAFTVTNNDSYSVEQTFSYNDATNPIAHNGWNDNLSSHTMMLNDLPVGLVKVLIHLTSASNNTFTCNIHNMSIAQLLTLDETTDYSSAFAAGLANVTMARTMNASQWQTFVAPFAMTQEQVETAFGSDVKVAKLTGKSGDALEFSTGDKTITANVPVMIYPSQAVTEITADGVTIVEGTPTQSESGVEFVGNYGGRIAIPAGAYFVADNQLYVASDGSNNIKNWRAYFTIPAGARLSGMTFDNGETTGISTTLMNSEESTVNSVFDLQGRRISQPQKGLYIVKGKKVIIK